MTTDVSCPNCQAKLKVPPGMAGKKAKCKQCGTSFRIPGENPNTPPSGADSVAESIGLSVADNAALRVVSASANPFSFEGGGTDPSPALAPPSAELPTAAAPPKADSPSKSKYRTSDKSTGSSKAKASNYSGGGKAGPQKSGGAKKFILIGLLVLLCAGGGGAAVFFFMQSPEKALAAKPASEKSKEPEKPRDKEKLKNKQNPKGNSDKGENAAANPAAGVGTPDVMATMNEPAKPKAVAPGMDRKRTSTVVIGGWKLPSFPPGPGMALSAPAGKFSVELSLSNVKQMFTSNAEAGILAAVWPSFAGFQGQGAKDTIERFSMNGGAIIDKTEMDVSGVSWPRAADLSPEGERYATETPAGKITIYDFNTKTKLWDGVEAFPGVDAAKNPGIAAMYL
ncbi:MAG: hypothetical protein ACRCZF_11655, partial [Gemmataceae bacterium]